MTRQLLFAFAICMLGVATVLTAPRARAATAGVATIVSEGTGTATSKVALEKGTRQTRFSLRLPDGAACAGDSATGLYRVQSFMVPEAVDPATLTFGSTGPLPAGTGAAFRQPLVQVTADPYTDAATNVAAKPDGVGVIINIPLFDLASFAEEQLPAGSYVLGIACTKGPASASQLDRYWAAKLTLGGAGSAQGWTAAAPVESSSGAGSDKSARAAPAPTAASGPNNSEAAGAAVVANATAAADDSVTSEGGGTPSMGIPALRLVPHVSSPTSSAPSFIGWLLLVAGASRASYLLRPRHFLPTGLTPA